MFSTLFMLRALTNQKKRFIFGVLFFRLWLFPGGPFQTVGGGGGVGGVRSHPSHPPPYAPVLVVVILVVVY